MLQPLDGPPPTPFGLQIRVKASPPALSLPPNSYSPRATHSLLTPGRQKISGEPHMCVLLDRALQIQLLNLHVILLLPSLVTSDKAVELTGPRVRQRSCLFLLFFAPILLPCSRFHLSVWSVRDCQSFLCF